MRASGWLALARAIAARLVWLREHPALAGERFGKESETDWDHVVWTFAEPRCLRELGEATLLWIFNCEVERLLRIVQESPLPTSSGEWTQATLVACAHLAGVYAELRRRHRAMRARAIVREELRRFITWPREGPATLQPAGD